MRALDLLTPHWAYSGRIVVAAVCVAGAFASLAGMRESYDAELDWLER